MSETTDDAVAAARGALQRIQGRDVPVEYRPRRRSGTGLARRLTRIAVADAAILVAATVIGFIMPLGMFGALGVMALLIAATVLLAIYPTDAPVAYERLRQSDVKALPAQTGRWLDAQRPQLPAPAQVLVDRIGDRLDALTPQLAALDDDAPAAQEIRKLVGEQLPEFVRGYQQVPGSLRGVPRNGKTPDAQLLDGLGVIDREIGQVTEQLAQGQLDTLETRSRFLEIKYKGDDAD